MSVQDMLGIIVLALGGIGTLLGAAWWMSALYSKVGHIQENTASTSSKLDTLTERMDGDLHEIRTEVRNAEKRVNELEVRVVKLETE